MLGLKKGKIFLIFSLCISTLFTISLIAAEETFDPKSSVTIIQSSAEVFPPGSVCAFDPASQAFPDRWCIRHRIDFDNHLYAIKTVLYDSISYDERFANIEYKGKVNLIFTGPKSMRPAFSLVFEDGKMLQPVELWLKDSDLSVDLPRIYKVNLHTKIIPHWFYNEEKEAYLLELSDGTLWNVPLQRSFNEIPFHTVLGIRIIKIGTSNNPVLINADSIWKNYPIVHEENYFIAEKNEQ